MYTGVLSVCPLLGGLSSFGVSFIGGFTVNSRPGGCITALLSATGLRGWSHADRGTEG